MGLSCPTWADVIQASARIQSVNQIWGINRAAGIYIYLQRLRARGVQRIRVRGPPVMCQSKLNRDRAPRIPSLDDEISSQLLFFRDRFHNNDFDTFCFKLTNQFCIGVTVSDQDINIGKRTEDKIAALAQL